MFGSARKRGQGVTLSACLKLKAAISYFSCRNSIWPMPYLPQSISASVTQSCQHVAVPIQKTKTCSVTLAHAERIHVEAAVCRANPPGIVVAAGQADGVFKAGLGAVKVFVGKVLMAAQRECISKGGVQLQGPLEIAQRRLMLLHNVSQTSHRLRSGQEPGAWTLVKSDLQTTSQSYS